MIDLNDNDKDKGAVRLNNNKACDSNDPNGSISNSNDSIFELNTYTIINLEGK